MASLGVGEGLGRSRKHKLFGDSQDTDHGTSSNRACGSWEDSDGQENYFCHQLSSLSIPHHGSHPKKKLKRRKNRKATRIRGKQTMPPAASTSGTSDITPTMTSPSHMRSDDTMEETMSIDSSDVESVISHRNFDNGGGTDADDELSCWEVTQSAWASEEEDMTESSNSSRRQNGGDTCTVSVDQTAWQKATSTAENVLNYHPVIRITKRDKSSRMKHRVTGNRPPGSIPYPEKHCGGSSTSSPSMSSKMELDKVLRRRFNPDGPGPSNSAMYCD